MVCSGEVLWVPKKLHKVSARFSKTGVMKRKPRALLQK